MYRILSCLEREKSRLVCTSRLFCILGLVQAFFATWLLIAQIIVFALTGGNGYSLTLVSF